MGFGAIRSASIVTFNSIPMKLWLYPPQTKSREDEVEFFPDPMLALVEEGDGEDGS